MNISKETKARFRKAVKDFAYSPLGRTVALRIASAPSDSPVRRALASRGFDASLHRVASEKLPSGMYFAKLTIGRWQDYEGRPFRLFQGSQVVYGNQIEPPARGFPLEYRNIIVSSSDKNDFSLDIEAPYSIAISEGAFSTPQQINYDDRYGVKHVGDVYYSLRGNTTKPKKMVITFPGFGPSTSRISYAVSYLKDMSESDLSETLMICFQDRYLAAGSYMMVDNAGRPLYNRVWQTIENLRAKYGIDESQILFFGASKGGSIAIEYAKDYPKATLLLAVPQMNLPYYFNKPFFRDNLFRNSEIRKMMQPADRLRQYFEEGRRIHYFYTNSDELSNFSLIEFARDIPNLSKYRIDGSHSSVARTALPAMFGIMRAFLSRQSPRNGFDCEQIRLFENDADLQVQLRIDSRGASISGANWFLEGTLGKTQFYQLLSDHRYPFVKFTSGQQSLNADYDSIDGIHSITAIESSGKISTSQIGPLDATRLESRASKSLSSPAIELDTKSPIPHVVIDGNSIGRFRYETFPAMSHTETLEVHYVSNVDMQSCLSEDLDRSTHVAIVESLDGGKFADIFALRLLIESGLKHLAVIVHDDAVESVHGTTLANVDWPGAAVEFLQDSSIGTNILRIDGNPLMYST